MAYPILIAGGTPVSGSGTTSVPTCVATTGGELLVSWMVFCDRLGGASITSPPANYNWFNGTGSMGGSLWTSIHVAWRYATVGETSATWTVSGACGHISALMKFSGANSTVSAYSPYGYGSNAAIFSTPYDVAVTRGYTFSEESLVLQIVGTHCPTGSAVNTLRCEQNAQDGQYQLGTNVHYTLYDNTFDFYTVAATSFLIPQSSAAGDINVGPNITEYRQINGTYATGDDDYVYMSFPIPSIRPNKLGMLMGG